MTSTYTLTGMTCSHCAQVVHNSLAKIPNVRSVEVDLDSATATIETEKPIMLQTLQDALADTVYEITNNTETEANDIPVQMDDLSEKNKHLVIDYIDAIGHLDAARLSQYLHPDFQFNGMLHYDSAEEYIKTIKEHAASPIANILLRNDIKAVFADGNECYAIYEIVTAMPGKNVPFFERITVTDGRISSTNVMFNKYCMKRLSREINNAKGNNA